MVLKKLLVEQVKQRQHLEFLLLVEQVEVLHITLVLEMEVVAALEGELEVHATIKLETEVLMEATQKNVLIQQAVHKVMEEVQIVEIGQEVDKKQQLVNLVKETQHHVQKALHTHMPVVEAVEQQDVPHNQTQVKVVQVTGGDAEAEEPVAEVVELELHQ